MSNGLSVPFPTEDEGFDLIIVRLGQLALTNASTTQIDCRSPPVPGAPGNQWILPRAKKCPPDTFYLVLRRGRPFESLLLFFANKKDHPNGWSFLLAGVDLMYIFK